MLLCWEDDFESTRDRWRCSSKASCLLQVEALCFDWSHKSCSQIAKPDLTKDFPAQNKPSAQNTMENTAHPSEEPLPKANALTALISTATYLYMFVVFLCYWGFLLPSNVLSFFPYKFETSTVASSISTAIIADLALLLAFIVPHSVLARTSVKTKMNLPQSLERSFFVLQTTVFMHLQMAYYQELPDVPPIWNIVEGSALYYAVLTMLAFGFLFLFSATFALDHFWLFGLSQGFGVDINKMLGLNATDLADGFVVRWHYALCAHPIMTGMFLGLWATPSMTAGHLLFASVNTMWMLGAIKHLEEPQLIAIIGERYEAYLNTTPRYVPSVCPFTGTPSSSAGASGKGCPFSSSGGGGGGYGSMNKSSMNRPCSNNGWEYQLE